MKGRLIELMAAAGLPYGDTTHTSNSRLAQELAVWADGLGATNLLHDALFHAYFVDGRNLADPDVLVAAATSSGLDSHEARAVLEERLFAEMIDVDWDAARQAGVTGVPTVVAAGLGVVGAQPYDVLESLMVRVGVRRRVTGVA
jgi:predicted DsbA family dithiol-disulfide isomerase